MPKVQAWECPHTGKLFRLVDEKKYRTHLNRLSKQRSEERAIREERNAFSQWFEESTAELNTPTKIGNWANDNFRRIFKHCNRGRINKGAKLNGILLNGKYNPMCSNSHSSPKGKKSNWSGRDPDTPRGYPGVKGRIKIYNSTCPFSSDSFFNETRTLESIGIHTGTGGGGGEASVYDVTLWLDDWPGLKAEVMRQSVAWEEESVIKRLRGERVSSFQVIWPDTNEIPDWDRNK
jgi:hypothetical protein